MRFKARLFPVMIALGFVACTVLQAEQTIENPAETAKFTISGVVEAQHSAEITADTEEVSNLKLRRIVAHGSEVRKQQAIAWFDTKDLDQRIHKESVDLKLAELAMAEAEFADEQFLENQKLDRDAANRVRKAAQQSLDNYNNIDRDEAVAAAEFSLKSAKESLENAQEELDQLQKMYEEDDLTEESEEIVLKRAKSAVETATYRLGLAETRYDRTLKQTIPEQTQAAQEAFDRAELAHAKAIRNLDDARTKKQIELTRQREQLKQQQAEFAALKAERKTLTLHAPFAGLVYHGELTRGRLGDKPSTLEAGATVTPDQVIYTVVSPRKLQIRAEVTEGQLAKLQVGSKGQATIEILPDLHVTATIKQLASIPMANNKFDCVLSLPLPKQPSEQPRTVVPGLNVSIAFGDVQQGSQDD